MDAIIFDCDGTLSDIEGIVELARMNHQLAPVAKLTEQAMSQTGMTSDIYQQRLDVVQPTREQCQALAQHYYDTRTPGLDALLDWAREQHRAIFVISAGVNPAVSLFAKQLNIPSEQVFAVDLSFDNNGHYQDFDRQSPMTQPAGKRTIVNNIAKSHAHLVYIGDGKNDLEVKDDVDMFIGYGGAFYRPSMASACQYYIREHTLAGVINIINS